MRKSAPLLAILVVAAVARYWAIDFCLPVTRCRPDEEALGNIVWHIFERDYNPHFFDWPSLFLYEVALGVVPYFKLGVWLGWFRGERHFAALIGNDPTIIITTARVLSATAGVLSVWLIARIARRLFDERTALVAALLLGLALLHVRDSHFGVTDVTATALVLVSFLFVVRFEASGARRDWISAAIAAGLAASTKYNAAICLVPLWWVTIAGAHARGRTMALRVGRCLAIGVIAAAAFVATTPYAVLDWPEFSRAIRNISSHLSDGHGVDLGRGWVYHLASSLRYGLGWPMLVAGLAGLAWLVTSRPRIGLVVALFPVTYYLLIGSGSTVFARYILPVVPFLCLTAAFAVTEAGAAAARRLGRPSWSAALVATTAVAIVAPSAWSVVAFDRLLAQTDSRVIASEWIATHFPGGATIASSGRQSAWVHYLWDAPGQPSRYKVKDLNETIDDPDVLVISTSLFDPDSQPNERARGLAARYERAFEVVAFEPGAIGNVYDWQDEFYLPLAGFRGIVRPGPTLTVYTRTR